MDMLLPKYKKIILRNSCDRYGISHFFAEQLRLPFVPRSFANWQHGWIWIDKLTPDKLFDVKTTRKSQSIIVCNVSEKKVLESAEYSNVTVGGLPFAYIPKQNVQPIPGALVAFLTHSSEGGKINNSSKYLYFDYLESIRKDFSKIFICIYWLDYNENIAYEIKRRGLVPLSGARPDDKYSLLRIRTILEYCPYVTSNMIGSHLLYALYAGCIVSLTEPLYDIRADMQKQLENYCDNEIDYILYGQDIDYIKANFSWLLVNHPLAGIKNVDYAKKNIGEEWMLSIEKIKEVLGWKMVDQLFGYGSGLIRRCMRKFNCTLNLKAIL